MTLLKNKNAGLLVAAIIFLIVGSMHLMRLISPFSVVMAGNEIPLWASTLFMPLGLRLAAWLFYLRKQ